MGFDDFQNNTEARNSSLKWKTANSNKIDLLIFALLNYLGYSTESKLKTHFVGIRWPENGHFFRKLLIDFYVHYNTVMYISTLQFGQTSFRHGCYTVYYFSLD